MFLNVLIDIVLYGCIDMILGPCDIRSKLMCLISLIGLS